MAQQMTLKDLITLKLKPKKGARHYEAYILLSSPTTGWIEGSSLEITDGENRPVVAVTEDFPDDEFYGEYDLGALLKSLPMETLQQFKVSRAKAPKPVSVRRK
jgi:hypothetical protein